MRSRWFHRPVLHRPHHGDSKRPTWLELFFDLVFVAAFIQLGNGLAENVTPRGFGGFAVVFAAMWVAWTGFTFYVNRFTVDDFVHRLIVFALMFAVVAMAVTAPDVVDGRPRNFAIAFAIAQGIVALLYLRSHRIPDGAAYARHWAMVFAVGAVIFAASALVPTPATWALWAAGLAYVLTAPFRRRQRILAETNPWDEEHISERYGLLTLIVIGESFVKVVTGIGSYGDLAPLLQASFTLLITCSIWWIYFDDVAGSDIRDRPLAPLVWLYAHLPLQIGITATGVAVKKAVHFDLHAPAPEAYRWLLAVSLGLTLIATAVIDAVTARREAELSDRLRVNVRGASGVLMILLAPAGAGMTGGLFLGLVLALCVAQVIFDMLSAPFEAEREDRERETIADEVRRLTAENKERSAPRPRPGDAVRLNAPSNLRRDFYFWLIEGSWVRFLLTAGVLFLVVNTFFAALYMLESGSIANAGPESFSDAFFFSVQTLATIGYGALSPATDYGNTISTLEAATGVLGVALTTGLAFTKLSRPRASVLFSNPMIINRLHGKSTLQFRVGNARGNDIVEASISVTAIVEDLSPEGQHMRRLIDLALRRARSPLFTLSWTVVHDLDDASPLSAIDWDTGRGTERLIGLSVTLVGHDGTYNQTIYARHFYAVEDIRPHHRFVDVISQLPDGRMAIDYTHFHETFLDPPKPAATAPLP
jgi:inward rectifier potassium channel